MTRPKFNLRFYNLLLWKSTRENCRHLASYLREPALWCAGPKMMPICQTHHREFWREKILSARVTRCDGVTQRSVTSHAVTRPCNLLPWSPHCQPLHCRMSHRHNLHQLEIWRLDAALDIKTLYIKYLNLNPSISFLKYCSAAIRPYNHIHQV